MPPSAVDDIRDLFRYTWWANDRTLDVAATRSAEQLNQDLGGSYPSVWLTLRHIAIADRNWHRRWVGEPKPATPPDFPGTTLDELRASWLVVRRDQDAFLDTLTPEMLEAPLPFVLLSGYANELPLGEILRHVVNHATYHRGQVATFLRRLGAAPQGTDLLLYCTTRKDTTGQPVPA
jgi:uncharacterized damage-inducible protein DinB